METVVTATVVTTTVVTVIVVTVSKGNEFPCGQDFPRVSGRGHRDHVAQLARMRASACKYVRACVRDGVVCGAPRADRGAKGQRQTGGPGQTWAGLGTPLGRLLDWSWSLIQPARDAERLVRRASLHRREGAGRGFSGRFDGARGD
jgi:hypothetical protein